MIKAVDLRKGKTVTYEGDVCIVHDAQHVAKGNKRSYMQTKLKSIKTGTIKDVRFNVDDRLEVPFMETKEFEYLYQEGDHYVLMDKTTFDQVSVPAELMGDAVNYLKSNETITATICEGRTVQDELPYVVELRVTETPPVLKGATATNQSKDAIMETGVKVRVPPFIEPGERIRVDTRTGEYVDRAK